MTIKIRFFPDNPELLRQLSREYIHTVNALTEQAEKEGSFPKVTTKDVDAHLPSAVLNQAIRDAKSVSKKMKKEGKRPILKKPVYFVNNQNYTIGEQMIAFPIMLDGKTRKTRFRAMVTERDKNLIQHAKLGLMRIVEKRGKWYAQVSLGIPVTEKKKEKVMGVDLGLKVPAVAVTSNGKTRFFGNGRQNKYIRRKYQQRRRKLGKLKKLSAIRKMNNKEQRIMKDINHKISRQIVNMAIKELVYSGWHLGAQLCDSIVCHREDKWGCVCRLTHIGGRVCTDFYFFFYWRYVRRPLAAKTNDDLVRPLKRYIDICNINGAPVWHMEVCFPRDICLRDPIAVLSTFGDEAVQSTCSGRTDAGGDVIIPDNDGYFYDHRSDFRHLRLSTIRHLHLYGGSRYSFSIICSCADLIAS
ncbi:hypothetical protein HNR78_002219 [Parageobacillus toebii NBRC 107807]|uniref:Probable transposase IS891/IS1136/IS1341 domain-containing protein n=1 Tax=Parageobacillus toebii NBRC 107807 TaxID=1223503 RepID=A0AA89T813_9BACL|nr:hypothetical protein [Parageobacillus toebii NBRC 107807]